MKAILAQINAAMGDFEGNTRKITEALRLAREQGARIVVFPELAVCGYPPEDLLFSKAFVAAAAASLRRIAGETRGLLAFVGAPVMEKGRLYNSAVAFRDGKQVAVCHKMLLPNYSVFDEKRYFTPGARPLVLTDSGLRIGVSICEDVWFPEGPLKSFKNGRIDLLVNLSASPYYASKVRLRDRTLAWAARTIKAPILYCNLVGGQDELVFDGCSFAVDAKGRTSARAAQFSEELLAVELDQGRVSGPKSLLLNRDDEVFRALVLGIRDYASKNGFSKAVLGLSGGIDSALVAVLAAEALGPENVMGVTLPTVFSSAGTRGDARLLAQRVGIPFREVPIQGLFEAFKQSLFPDFKDLPENTAEENLQARIRACILMAYSNKFNMLLLNTGNKSESSVGYCTLYGDMAGGYAPIKDLTKDMVYRLSRLCNARGKGEVIPLSIIERPPTAELRDNQRDSDSLPPYEVLDKILRLHIEGNLDSGAIAARGFDRCRVREVLRLVRVSEYKRRQAPPGAKITPLALGKDRRMPITNRFER